MYEYEHSAGEYLETENLRTPPIAICAISGKTKDLGNKLDWLPIAKSCSNSNSSRYNTKITYASAEGLHKWVSVAPSNNNK